MIKDKEHSLENNIISKHIDSKIVIVDFNNILLSFYYQFIDVLSKFVITNYLSDIKNINYIYNKILENFIRNHFIYFLRTKLHISNIEQNYNFFIHKYIKYLKEETNFSEKTIKYIEEYLLTNKIIPNNKDPKYFINEFSKLINVIIIFVVLKLFFIDFRETINNKNIIFIFILRDDFSSINNYQPFTDLIEYYNKNNILHKISFFLSNILKTNVLLAIKYVRRIDRSSIKSEIDDLHCLNFFIDLHTNFKNNLILFSNDKYRKILSADFSFPHESLFISNFSNKIIYNLYTNTDTQLILNKLKQNKYLELYTSANVKYKNYSFGVLNPLIFDAYKKIIVFIINFFDF
jgi:hypothetical protein